jgi:hypothetical protein
MQGEQVEDVFSQLLWETVLKLRGERLPASVDQD